MYGIAHVKVYNLCGFLMCFIQGSIKTCVPHASEQIAHE